MACAFGDCPSEQQQQLTDCVQFPEACTPPKDPFRKCVAECLTKKAGRTVVVSGATYAAAYAAVVALAPEITVPATIIVVAVKKKYGVYYITAKIVWSAVDCYRQCECQQ